MDLNKVTQQFTEIILDKLVDFITTSSYKNKDLLFVINEFKKSSNIENIIVKDSNRCGYIYKKGNHINEQCKVMVRDGFYCAKHKKQTKDESFETEIEEKSSNVVNNNIYSEDNNIELNSSIKKIKIDEIIISEEEQSEIDEDDSLLPSEPEDVEDFDETDYEEE